MTFGIRYDVPAPIQLYDAVHTELLRRCNEDLVGPVMAEVTDDQAPPESAPAPEEFGVRGLVIPGGDVAF